MIGYWATALWTLGPYVAVPLFVDRYHDRYVDQFLPLPLGLTAMADYTGTVFLLLSAVFTLRAIENRDPGTAAVAGLAAGFAAVVKPSNLIFLAAPAVALLAARRWRELLVGAAALAPAVLALALWKYRGYGYLPAFASQETVVALGPDSLTAPYDKYVDINWDNIGDNLASLREVFWSMRVLQWLPFAGAIAVARRSIPVALMLSVWFWAFFVLKGSSDDASVDSGAFFRFLLPAIPAFLLLGASLPLLIPKYGIELARRDGVAQAARPGGARSSRPRWCWGCFPSSRRPRPPRCAALTRCSSTSRSPCRFAGSTSRRRASPSSGCAGRSPTRARRASSTSSSAARPDTDYLCFTDGGGADRCTLVSVELKTLRKTSAVDRPGPGTWTYRVGAAANWIDDPELGDVFLLSNPVTVTVP